MALWPKRLEKVTRDLVVSDKNGKAYTVRYDEVNAMLLSQFLKEHRKVEKLEATVADLATQLQRVTAQIQVTTGRTTNGSEQSITRASDRI